MDAILRSDRTKITQFEKTDESPDKLHKDDGPHGPHQKQEATFSDGEEGRDDVEYSV